MKKDGIVKVNFEEREQMYYGPLNDLIHERRKGCLFWKNG
jgi:hypothetical protein